MVIEHEQVLVRLDEIDDPAGGLLLALRETGELVRAIGVPTWAFWPTIVVLLIASTLFTIARQHVSRRFIREAEAEHGS